MDDAFFPYGAQYYRTPNPPSRDWERDLREMKNQGMNTVRLWAMWSWIHTAEGEYDFSHLDLLLDLCQRIGLKAVIQVVLENAPAWLIHRHPEAQYTANDGQQISPMGRPNTPGGGWPGLCFDNPAPRAAAEDFMTALAKHFTGNDALLAYDVWNEVWFELDGYIGRQNYCYCPATIEKFRDYLRNVYGDLDSLSQAWSRRYSDWEEVLPPRHWGGYPDWIDWLKFRLKSQGDLLRRRVQTLRAADPNVLLICHGLPTTIGSMCTQLTDDWRNAKEVDIYGLSCFPLWFNYDNIETFKVHDMIRGASNGKTFWTAEMQAGPSGEGLMHSRTPDLEDIRLWNWISLASGAKGVLYWQWRPELLGPESPGFGLCHLNGDPSERVNTALNFARLIQAHPELRESKPVKGEVAIAVLPESQIFCHISDRNAGKYAQAVRGAYRALSEAGYQVDFAVLDQIEDYPLIYLPFSLMIEEKSATRLIDYVKYGGMIISEASPALFSDHGFTQASPPGCGLSDVFGVRFKDGPETVSENAPLIQWNGRSLWCAVHRQKMTAHNSHVLAEYSDGGPALTENEFGAGRAVLIGTYPGLCYEWGCKDAGLLIADLARHIGIAPRATSSDQEVWVRLHICDYNTLAYIVNLSPETKDVTISISNQVGEFISLEDIISGESIAINDGSFDLQLPGRDARVLGLTPALYRKESIL